MEYRKQSVESPGMFSFMIFSILIESSSSIIVATYIYIYIYHYYAMHKHIFTRMEMYLIHILNKFSMFVEDNGFHNCCEM